MTYLCYVIFHAVDGDWETHHDQLAYVGYEVGYPDDEFDELELQEVFHPQCLTSALIFINSTY